MDKQVVDRSDLDERFLRNGESEELSPSGRSSKCSVRNFRNVPLRGKGANKYLNYGRTFGDYVAFSPEDKQDIIRAAVGEVFDTLWAKNKKHAASLVGGLLEHTPDEFVRKLQTLISPQKSSKVVAAFMKAAFLFAKTDYRHEKYQSGYAVFRYHKNDMRSINAKKPAMFAMFSGIEENDSPLLVIKKDAQIWVISTDRFSSLDQFANHINTTFKDKRTKPQRRLTSIRAMAQKL